MFHIPLLLGIQHPTNMWRWCETNPQKGDVYQPLLNAFYSSPNPPSDICQLNLVGQQLTHHLLTSARMPGVVAKWLVMALSKHMEIPWDTLKLSTVSRNNDEKPIATLTCSGQTQMLNKQWEQLVTACYSLKNLCLAHNQGSFTGNCLARSKKSLITVLALLCEDNINTILQNHVNIQDLQQQIDSSETLQETEMPAFCILHHFTTTDAAVLFHFSIKFKSMVQWLPTPSWKILSVGSSRNGR